MSNLQFQSFTNQNFDMSDESPGRIGDGSTEDSSTAAVGPKKNFFSFSFYQQYFDVDTDQVTKRIMNSAIPTHKNYITEFVQPMPDLYGPFWICCTLVFSIGIFSNIAQYIENQGGVGEYGSDFRMVTGASSLIASYVLIIPFIISTTLWYRKADIQYSFLEVVCAYGYSLAIFIPVSMLWVIDLSMLRWALIFVSVALSGGVLARAIAPAFAGDNNKIIALGSVVLVIVLHFGLALCFKEYFFDAAMPSKAVVPTTTAVPAVVNVPGSTLPPSVVEPAAGGAKNDNKPPVAAALHAAPEVVAAAATAAEKVSNATVAAAAPTTTTSTTAAAAASAATAKIEKRDNSTTIVEKVEEKKEAPAAPVASDAAPAATVAAAAAAADPKLPSEKSEGVSIAATENTVVAKVTVPEKTNSTL